MKDVAPIQTRTLIDAESLNINISAYRVLYILLLLVQHRSLSLTELNQYLYDNPLIQRSYNNETITKYVNTLRKAGCGIPRSSIRNDFHYELQKSPFPLDLTDEEVTCLLRSISVLRQKGDVAGYSAYQGLMGKILWSLSNPAQDAQIEAALQPMDEQTEAAWVDIRQRQALLGKFQSLCQDARRLQLDYDEAGAKKNTLTIEPNRVSIEGESLVLLAQDCQAHKTVRLNLEKIYSVRQLPSKNRLDCPETTIVFQLYGRLARNYRPYPGEEVHTLGEETLQVRSKTDDPQSLLQRLLKYDRSCQVISPAHVRADMRERIEALLSTLQGDETAAEDLTPTPLEFN